MASNDDIRPWTCSVHKEHILGQVRRNGNKVRQLLLYRQAIDLNEECPEQVDVMAVVEGYVADVTCSICGATRTWVPGEESLTRLLEQMQKRGQLKTV